MPVSLSTTVTMMKVGTHFDDVADRAVTAAFLMMLLMMVELVGSKLPTDI